MRRRFLSYKGSFDYSDYMTVEALIDGVTIIMPKDVEYNMGKEWVALEAGASTPTLNKGEYISFRGHLLSGTFGTIEISGSCSLRGNCMSLIGKSVPHYGAFERLFARCPIVNVESNFLPATRLTSYCYDSMFYGCTRLTTAPKLPATTLASRCYNSMFYGTNILPDCSNIDFTSNTVVSSGGLNGLFAGTKVTDNDLYNILPINPSTGKYWLPATTLASSCYDSMFSDCPNLTTAPELPATTLASSCYESMFSGCTRLTTAPELPATTLVSHCYDSMFSDCPNLTTAPELPATTLVSHCYNRMFYCCISLNYIKMLATDISATNCLNRWVYNVSHTGTFVKNKDAAWDVAGENGIPSRWTIQKV